MAYLGIRSVPPKCLMPPRRLNLPEFDVPRPLTVEQLRILSSWQIVLISVGTDQQITLHLLGQLRSGQFVILVVRLSTALFAAVNHQV